MAALTIGKVARRAGVGVETIRFYERVGVLEPAQRGESGYRQYRQETVNRLRFIRRAKELGFTLREIRELLSLRIDTQATSVKSRAQAKVADIDARIQSLDRMKRALSELLMACDGKGEIGAGCPIMEALDGKGGAE